MNTKDDADTTSTNPTIPCDLLARARVRSKVVYASDEPFCLDESSAFEELELRAAAPAAPARRAPPARGAPRGEHAGEHGCLVKLGWELSRREADGCWVTRAWHWHDFRDEFRPGLGQEEWPRICG